MGKKLTEWDMLWLLAHNKLGIEKVYPEICQLEVATLFVLADDTKLSQHTWVESSHPEGPAQAGGLGQQALCEIQTDKKHYQNVIASVYTCVFG